jgi:chromosome segregation ATPase
MSQTLEYSVHQKEQIAKQILEFYKDGKYAYDDDVKKQSQTHYNKKSEIMKDIDSWTKIASVVKWIIPLVDFNLECDYEALEKEWDKQHLMAIKVENLENKYHLMEQHLEAEGRKIAQKMMDEWVSENEEVALLHEQLQEKDNRWKEQNKRHNRDTQYNQRKIDQLEQCIERMKDQVRETQTTRIEAELKESEQQPTLKKQNKKLEDNISKYEKENIKLTKQKMSAEMKYLELKQKSDDEIRKMKDQCDTKINKLETQLQKLSLELNYMKLIKDADHPVIFQAQAQVQEATPPPQLAVEEVGVI